MVLGSLFGLVRASIVGEHAISGNRIGLICAFSHQGRQHSAHSLRFPEALFGVGFVSYHLIEFSREALRGDQNASFYSARARAPVERAA
jgi:hypothetical protein